MDSFSNLGIRSRRAICLLALSISTAWLPVSLAPADDPSPKTVQSSSQSRSDKLTPADYIRTDLTVDNGLPNNVVNAIVETENGLLWVGTESGLASFDGRDFSPVDLQPAGSPAQGAIHSLLESSEGDLWVGTDAGVVRIPKAALDQFSLSLLTFFQLGEEPSNEVLELFEARDGTLWAGSHHGLYRKDSGKFVELVSGPISRIAETSEGHLLVIDGAKLIEWDGRNPIQRPDLVAGAGVPESEIFDVFQDHEGTMWYSTRAGILRRGPKPLPPLRPLVASKTASFRRPYTDSQDNKWVVTGTGVYRIIGDEMEDTPVPEVLPRCFLADHDGGFWVGTNGNGLIHLKRRTVHMFTKMDGLISNIPMAVLASHDGKLWIGCNCGLSAYDGKRFTSYAEKEGLSNSCVWSLAEDQHRNLWIGTYGGGLFRFKDEQFAQYSLKEGLVSQIVLQVAVARDGSLWLATPDGISHMRNGQFRNYTRADGLSSNHVLAIHQDRLGTIWAATQGGIDRLIGDRFVSFHSGQPQAAPFSVRFSEDSAGNLYTADSPKGISLIKNNEIRVVNEDLKVSDMVESPRRDLWFSGTNGILRIRPADLASSRDDRDTPLDYQLIDRADGLNSIQCSTGSPNMAVTSDKKLWVATVKGLAMLDLARLPEAVHKPKVFIGAVTVGKNRLLAGSETVLPPGTQHLEIHLQAVDLSSPEKILLQYRLEGVDAVWLDASASRTAVYTNIPVGSHAFHVRASSSDGMWDRSGVVFNITQRPYFYQTLWFRSLGIFAVFAILWFAYLMRLKQVTRRVQDRMYERLAERERIARDLHDTFFQGIQGLFLRFHTAASQLPQNEPARDVFENVLRQSDDVMKEGRELLLDLRSTAPGRQDLPTALAKAGSQFQEVHPCKFNVIVNGEARTLRPVVSDELTQIGKEALSNAFRHSNASQIEVEVLYEQDQLCLRIRDDGEGIDQKILEEGQRSGHWGLPGMRERAQKLGTRVEMWSRPGAGTEVELRIPARLAYASEVNGYSTPWFRIVWKRKGKDVTMRRNSESG
jgi:signal transduction histidine kinase/ligand-binding sensor domain-containing protein